MRLFATASEYLFLSAFPGTSRGVLAAPAIYAFDQPSTEVCASIISVYAARDLSSTDQGLQEEAERECALFSAGKLQQNRASTILSALLGRPMHVHGNLLVRGAVGGFAACQDALWRELRSFSAHEDTIIVLAVSDHKIVVGSKDSQQAEDAASLLGEDVSLANLAEIFAHAPDLSIEGVRGGWSDLSVRLKDALRVVADARARGQVALLIESRVNRSRSLYRTEQREMVTVSWAAEDAVDRSYLLESFLTRGLPNASHMDTAIAMANRGEIGVFPGDILNTAMCKRAWESDSSVRAAMAFGWRPHHRMPFLRPVYPKKWKPVLSLEELVRI